MINLLPKSEEKQLQGERRKTIINIYWILFLFFLCFLFLILLIIKIYLDSEIASQKIILNEANSELQRLGISDLAEKVGSANKNLAGLDAFYSQKNNFSAVFDELSKILPEKVSLTNVSIENYQNGGETSQNKKILKVSIAGKAAGRDDLLELKNNIEKSNVFFGADFPSSDWLQTVNIDFSISFECNNPSF